MGVGEDGRPMVKRRKEKSKQGEKIQPGGEAFFACLVMEKSTGEAEDKGCTAGTGKGRTTPDGADLGGNSPKGFKPGT